jgi:hypothetical protein
MSLGAAAKTRIAFDIFESFLDCVSLRNATRQARHLDCVTATLDIRNKSDITHH